MGELIEKVACPRLNKSQNKELGKVEILVLFESQYDGGGSYEGKESTKIMCDEYDPHTKKCRLDKKKCIYFQWKYL